MTLLPCPFCGNSKGNLIDTWTTNHSVSHITCAACGARGPVKESEFRAREAWNTRTNNAPDPGSAKAEAVPSPSSPGEASTPTQGREHLSGAARMIYEDLARLEAETGYCAICAKPLPVCEC